MSLVAKLEKIVEKFNKLNEQMMDVGKLSGQEYAKIAKEHSDMQEVKDLAIEYIKAKKDVVENQAMLKDPATDVEFKSIIESDVANLNELIEALTIKIKIALIPKDEADAKNAIIEVRAGTGGEEAALFAAVLFRMYQKYADKHGWKFEPISIAATGLDGIKEASATISGKDVFARLKYESGVHRVQRVPETESSGRIHTSAATVAVLPEAEEVDIEIKESDLRIDVFRASGAGGQHVNTTDSAVRITHLPTGVAVSQQDEKSQHKNKAKALKILRSRLYEAERQKKEMERSSMRKSQVGSGDRSERIRTYNYPQSRVTDHRVNVTSYNLNSVLNEGAFDEFIDALIQQDQADKLAEDID
ncbi:MAG: peptide chain release factor 1 [Rickettsiales bacterium]